MFTQILKLRESVVDLRKSLPKLVENVQYFKNQSIELRDELRISKLMVQVLCLLNRISIAESNANFRAVRITAVDGYVYKTTIIR